VFRISERICSIDIEMHIAWARYMDNGWNIGYIENAEYKAY